MKALLHTKEKQDPRGWQAFQKQANTLKLQRSRMQRELEELQGVLFSATQQMEAEIDDEAGEPQDHQRVLNRQANYRMMNVRCECPDCRRLSRYAALRSH